MIGLILAAGRLFKNLGFETEKGGRLKRPDHASSITFMVIESVIID